MPKPDGARCDQRPVRGQEVPRVRPRSGNRRERQEPPDGRQERRVRGARDASGQQGIAAIDATSRTITSGPLRSISRPYQLSASGTSVSTGGVRVVSRDGGDDVGVEASGRVDEAGVVVDPEVVEVKSDGAV